MRWRNPQSQEERAVKEAINSFARIQAASPCIAQPEHPFHRYYLAQALALRAWVSYAAPIGGLDRERLKNLVEKLGERAGIDWEELEPYDEP